MPKQTKEPLPKYIPKTDNVFYLYLGKERYFLFMSMPPKKYLLPVEQIKLLNS